MQDKADINLIVVGVFLFLHITSFVGTWKLEFEKDISNERSNCMTVKIQIISAGDTIYPCNNAEIGRQTFTVPDTVIVE